MYRENDVRLNTDSIKWYSTWYSFGNFTIRQYDDSTNWHSTTRCFGKTTIRWNYVSGKWCGPTFRCGERASNNCAISRLQRWTSYFQSSGRLGQSAKLSFDVPEVRIWPLPAYKDIGWKSRISAGTYTGLSRWLPRRLGVATILYTALTCMCTLYTMHTHVPIKRAFKS